MNENIENSAVLPEVADNNSTDNEVQTIAPEVEERVIPVKYNKEIINLDFEKAGELAQKGMKFEAIANEIELLKELAVAENKTIKQYLGDLQLKKANSKRDSLVEKCKDDEELASEVLRLYDRAIDLNDGFGELVQEFPEIKTREDLPQSVVENAKLCGRPLLDEYLRYRLSQEKAILQNELAKQQAIESSVGSQLNKSRGENPEAAEFLKGLWRK